MRHLARAVVNLLTAGIVTGLIAFGFGAAGASAAAPIKPHQHFVGIVNGSGPSSSAAGPVVYTVCPGPTYPGRTGPVAGGQTLAVTMVHQGGGYTGPFSQIYAWFVQDSSSGGPQRATFVRYDTPMPMPSGAQVPCDGTGQVTFSSCPPFAPCVAGWTPYTVPVRFENIAL